MEDGRAKPEGGRTRARAGLKTRDQVEAEKSAAAAPVERDTDILDALGREGEIVLNRRRFKLSPWRLGGLKQGALRYGSMKAFQDALAGLMPPVVLVEGSTDRYQYDFDNWDPDLDTLQFCVWLSLRREQPDLRLEDLEDLLPINQLELFTIIRDAMHVAALDDPTQEGSSGPPV